MAWRRRFRLSFAAFPLLLAACGEPAANPGGDVTGAWCGIDVADAPSCLGDEVIYAELTQSGGGTGQAVTGMSCDHYNAGSGCYELDGGGMTSRVLTFFYTFGVNRVDARLTLSEDQQSLAGTYTSTKCVCDVPVTLHRLP
jgi:hypothetical protein